MPNIQASARIILAMISKPSGGYLLLVAPKLADRASFNLLPLRHTLRDRLRDPSSIFGQKRSIQTSRHLLLQPKGLRHSQSYNHLAPPLLRSHKRCSFSSGRLVASSPQRHCLHSFSAMASNGVSNGPIETPPRCPSPAHNFGTRAVHAGSPHDPVTGAVIAPVSWRRLRWSRTQLTDLRRSPCPQPTRRPRQVNPLASTNTQEARIQTGTSSTHTPVWV